MDTTPEKDQMLRSAGFRYYFDRMAYVNRKAKKIISVEAVDDTNEQLLSKMIAEPNESGEWQFYFTNGQQPPRAVKEAFIAELG